LSLFIKIKLGEDMAFTTRNTDELIRIAAAGGGFRLVAGVRTTDDLIRIAAAAKSGGARVYFSGMSTRITEDLIRIGAAGKSSVVFED
jgi:hypothetical protein